MSSTSTEHLCCFLFSVFIFVYRNLLHPISSTSSATHCLALSHPPPPLTPPVIFCWQYLCLSLPMRGRNLSALKTYTTHLCVGQHFTDESLSTQRLYMHAFAFENAEPDVQDKTVRCYICTHISHPSSCFWHMPSCLSRQKKKKITYRRCTREIWLIQRHYHGSIFHTFIFICSYLKPDFSFVSILTHFTLYYHTYHALLEVFIYQSTLDSELFFSIGIHFRVKYQEPWFNNWNRHLGLSFFLFGWAVLTQMCFL